MSANFHPIDIALADELLKDHPSVDRQLISYLFAALRAGHLCIKIEANRIQPAPEDLDLEISFPKNIPESLPKDLFVHEDSRLYFSKQWHLETRFISRFEQLCKTPPSLQITDYEMDPSLLPEQQNAILSSFKQSITLITGGPGTGKTYTAGRLLHLLKNGINHDCQIALAAPTGKAAANLQRSLTNAVDAKATTLHTLLKNNQHLAADIVIIDECSMIDVEMMVRLLEAIKPGARLIMLGDPQQLPPIEAGGLFADLAKVYPTNHLKVCRRAELKSILELADLINRGAADEALEFLKTQGWIKLMKDPKDLLKATEKHFITTNQDPDYLLNFFGKFRILTPMRHGLWGSESLNMLFKNALMDYAAPVMISKNDHELALFNGEVGVLTLKNRPFEGFFREGDCAYFDSGNGLRKIPAILLPKFEYAYCMSVHKSQGSEFEHVHVILPEGAEIFGREVLYTAITRASRGVTLWTTEETLRKTILKQSIRHSGLDERLGQFVFEVV